jgi:Protein of unknown function (DUF4232)
MYRLRFSSSRLAGVVASVCALGLATFALLSAGTAAASTPACGSFGLVVWVTNSPGGAAAGTDYFDLEFTNLSGHTCTVTGYPGVSAVNLAGQQVGSPAGRNAQHSAHPITLANGGSASVVLGIVDAGNFPPSRCHSVIAAGLRVYPPGQTASRVVPFPFEACSRTGTTYLTIEAAQKGNSVE